MDDIDDQVPSSSFLLRELVLRIPNVLLIAFLALLCFADVDQLQVLWQSDYGFGQLLAMFLCAAIPSVVLLFTCWEQRASSVANCRLFDLGLSLLPIGMLFFALTAHTEEKTYAATAALMFVLGFFVLYPVFHAEFRIRFNWGMIAVTAVWLFVVVAVTVSPVEFPRAIGTLFFALMFFGLLAIWFQQFLLYPIAGSVIALIFGTSFFINEQSHVLRVKDYTDHLNYARNEEPIRSPISIQYAFESWLKSRNDIDHYVGSGRPYPIFLVSAEGGGGYAAAHSFLFLTKMQQRCPNFAQHVFALTGVSGGAVGNALFWKENQPLKNPETALGCGSEVELDQHFDLLSQDNLSPVIASMLFRDLPNKMLFGLLGGFDRTDVFIQSISGEQQLGVPGSPYYWEHYWSSSDDETGVKILGNPAIIPIATNLVSGKPYIIAPFELDDLRNGFEQTRCMTCELSYTGPDEIGMRTSDIGFFDAAAASASFPYVTPSVVLPGVSGSGVGLVDGGYLDNSGTEVMLEILKALKVPNKWADGIENRKIGQFNNANTRFLQNCQQGELYDEIVIQVKSRPYEYPASSTGDSENNIGKEDCVVEVEFFTITLRAEPSRDKYISSQNFFLDPFHALINGRSRRAELARLRLFDYQCAAGAICPGQVELGAQVGYFDSVIRPEDHSLPLGWHMPKANIVEMAKLIAPSPDAVIEENFVRFNDINSYLAWQADVFSGVADNPTSVQAVQDALAP